LLNDRLDRFHLYISTRQAGCKCALHLDIWRDAGIWCRLSVTRR
jgi:hypothetical protein